MKPRLAFSEKVKGHEVIVVDSEFRDDCLLIVNGETIGYVKLDYLETAIKNATRYPRFGLKAR